MEVSQAGAVTNAITLERAPGPSRSWAKSLSTLPERPRGRHPINVIIIEC